MCLRGGMAVDVSSCVDCFLGILYLVFAFCAALFLGALKGVLVGPVASLILILGNVGVILGMCPAHVAWTICTIIKVDRIDIPLKVAIVLGLLTLFVKWLGFSLAGSVLVGVGYGFFTPWVSTFEAFRHVDNKFYHCVVDWTWGTIKGSCTVVRDFSDLCYHFYPLYLTEAFRQLDNKFYHCVVFVKPRDESKLSQHIPCILFQQKRSGAVFAYLLYFDIGQLNFSESENEIYSNSVKISKNVDDIDGSKRKRLTPGQVSPPRHVSNHILRPPYVKSRQPPGIASELEVHDEKGMRASGKLAAQLLEFAGTLVKPGIKTDEIDEAVHQMIIDKGAYPSPLGYGGSPKSVCTSVNECICHGIPDSRALEGYHGDTSATLFCGEVEEEAKNLVQITKECLHKAILICAPGVEYKKIGRTINDHADKYGYGVVWQFVGHGVGRVFHADPVVLHHRNNDGGRMVLNQTFTIEPMLTIGSINPVMWDDNWTVLTEDGSLSAQFEHTILITEDVAEILTQC